ncbi:MAG TPA: glycerophosphodiester phosphodiesterase family protein [Candidatus Saccharimonadales bacterium]
MKIIGHRGAKGLAPENTLQAFEKALACNVDEIELDVRVTSDNQPVLIHDSYLRNRAGGKLKVDRHTFAELRQYKPDLASLDEAIAYVHRRVPILVEVKPHVATAPIVRVLEKFLAQGWSTADFSLASFNQKTLVELHRKLPDIPTVVIESWSGVRAGWRMRQLKTRRVIMNTRWLWAGFLAPIKRSGYQIAPYTVNNPAKVRKWQKYLYGVVTDYPDRFTS